MLDNFVYW